MITSHPFYKAMKMTLDNLTTDDLEKKQVCIGPGKLIPKLESMKDGYVDDAESAGTTLLVQKAQGAPLTPEDIVLGGTSRYWPSRCPHHRNGSRCRLAARRAIR